MKRSIYDLNATLANGESLSLAAFKDKVLLIVNTASKCRFTPQYGGMQRIYSKYSNRGFEVLAFPCNQFALQEPGDEDEIVSFCSLQYDVSFPIFKKIDVNGPDAHPLYNYLKRQKRGVLGRRIMWNFEKFLVDGSGKVHKRYAPWIKLDRMESDIEGLLPAAANEPAVASV